MKLIISVFIAMMLTLSVNAKGTKAVEIANNVDNKTQIYNFVNDNNEFVKFEYTIDGNDRVIGKVCYHYSMLSHDWEPEYIYTVKYDGGESTLTYAKWNEASKSFSSNIQVQSFKEPFKELLTLPSE